MGTKPDSANAHVEAEPVTCNRSEGPRNGGSLRGLAAAACLACACNFAPLARLELVDAPADSSEATDGSQVDSPVVEAPAPVDASSETDAGQAIDAPPPDTNLCFGTGLLMLCLSALPTNPVTMGVRTLDTSDNASCTHIVAQTNGPELCVIAGTTVSVIGLITAVGSRALVLVATDEVSISAQGAIDASSKISPRRTGAAANTGTCSTAGNGENDSDGGGGGAGGSFGTVGGNGGEGISGIDAEGGSTGGVQTSFALLRGGCRGGAGGGRVNGGSGGGGLGGEGGGAVYLIARNTITIDGGVFASGAGGGTNPASVGRDQGGGGGGTGGMIGLDAPMIQLGTDGRVVANGGGGGGGGGSIGSSGEGGSPGSDGATTDFDSRAAGGVGRLGGGNGGPGAALNATTNQNGTDSSFGGGGGGGGIGVVLVFGAISDTSRISPAPR